MNKTDITPFIKMKEYFNSREFSLKFSIIQGQKSISGMALKAGSQEVEGLSFDEFQYLCDTLYYVLKDRVEDDEDDDGYLFQNLEYRGYMFRLLARGDIRMYNCKRKN